MSRIVDIEPLLKKFDRLDEETKCSPVHFKNELMALEQLLYTEKEELLRVGKGALKSIQGRFVVYDVEWLKEHFYTTEEKIYGQLKQPCENCVSREAVLSLQAEYAEEIGATTFWKLRDDIRELPSVTPQRPKGKWIDGYCSECGKSCLCDGWGIDIESKYCPNCGAEMEVDI